MILDKLNVLKVNGESLIDKEKEVVINYLLSRQKTTVEQLKRFLASRYNLKVNDVLISNIKLKNVKKKLVNLQLNFLKLIKKLKTYLMKKKFII